jgi:hypothetical protein
MAANEREVRQLGGDKQGQTAGGHDPSLSRGMSSLDATD